MSVFYSALGLALLAGVALVVVALYNRLVALNRRCDQAAADIDVQLKLRCDLVPNLVETVKGYAGHERATLEEVMRARTAAVAAPAGPARIEAEGLLGNALGRLMMVAEAYPDLKASVSFAELQAQLSDIEHTIAASRRFLNAAATEYNTTREQFPTNLLADMFAFGPKEIAAVPREARAALEAAPSVHF